jgi:hypothetical protein
MADPLSPVRTGEAAPTSTEAGCSLEAEIEALSRLGLDALRMRWRQCLRTAPPPHLSRPLLFRLLAYKIQARLFGDLDRETARFLDRIETERVRRRAAGESKPKAPPPIPPVPSHRSLKPGTLLGREHEGQMHQVTVMTEGFAWNGQVYPSLSEIARLITGTRWNGPRFFGLRDKGVRAADHPS